MVATDLDGTLLRSDHTVSDLTRSVLADLTRAGVTLVMVTGRPVRWMAPVVAQTGHVGVAVCANGAVTYDLSLERVVSARTLPVDVAAEVVARLLEAVPGVAFALEYADGSFARTPDYRARATGNEPEVAPVGRLLRGDIVKLLARHEGLDPDELLAAAAVVLDGVAESTHSSPGGAAGALLEVGPPGVSKATGLADVVAGLGLGPQDVVAFGDMPNDLPMLAWAGRSVGVEGGHPDVRALADEVAGPPDDDGVARWLLAHVLG